MAETKKTSKPSAQSSKRAAPGRPFAKGKSGNPGGRPKLPEELKQAFRALAPEALKTLESVMRSSKARPGDRIRAAETILNRGYGTPVQAVEVTGRDGGPIESMTHEQALARLAELRKADGDA